MILSNFGLGLDGSVLVFSTLLLGSSFRVSLESRKPSPKTGQSKPYEDEDGTATEESQKAYSVRTQNFLLIAVSALGFSAALVESVLATLHSWTLSNNVWINFAVWVGQRIPILHLGDHSIFTILIGYCGCSNCLRCYWTPTSILFPPSCKNSRFFHFLFFSACVSNLFNSKRWLERNDKSPKLSWRL